MTSPQQPDRTGGVKLRASESMITAVAPREARQAAAQSGAIKRIAVDRLVPGMCLRQVCGSWMDHPLLFRWKLSRLARLWLPPR